MGIMDGRRGLVTAAADGIGRASALAFAEQGARVLVSDLNDEGGAQTVQLIREAGGTAEFLHANAASEDDAAALVARVVELWGGLDFAHNNAGIGAATMPIVDQQDADWQRVFGVNVFGVMFGLKHQMRQMRAQGSGGAIVNTASIAGKSGNPGLSPYVTSKWGVIGLTQTAAVEGAPDGIRVNAFCPGATMTTALEHWSKEAPEQFAAFERQIPMGRVGTPAEQANAAVWLCSPLSSYVTGVALNVDGGSGIVR